MDEPGKGMMENDKSSQHGYVTDPKHIATYLLGSRSR
jgi:hypothetical protein